MPFFFDPTFILLIPALILGIWAQRKVSSNFKKYSKVPSARGLSGAQAARLLLDQAGLSGVSIEGVPGKLTDHYDPKKKVLRLSADVAGSTSLAAIGVAAHEAGHALQDAEHYAPMRIRTAIVPLANFGSALFWPTFLGGIFLGWGPLLKIGIFAYSFAVLFHIVTLPVEFNASSRALSYLTDHGILVPEEIKGARKVLGAAAMTYVASTLAAILNLVRMLLLARD